MLTNYQNVDDATIQEWADQFNRDGYLFLPEVLTEDLCARLREDLDRELNDPKSPRHPGDDPKASMRLCMRMFEASQANLSLFDMDPIAKFAETLIADGNPQVAEGVHVTHNNSFITRPGGGITSWHQDDTPHFRITHGEAPTNVQLPVLFFTANYYLTDVTEKAHGGTEVIPRSHLWGEQPPAGLDIDSSPYAGQYVSCLGKAGSVAMFNNQVWHRGGPNKSDRTRYITQVTYGRRCINHMFYPFMNYTMPEHVYKDANPRLKRLLGFLPSGAYG